MQFIRFNTQHYKLRDYIEIAIGTKSLAFIHLNYEYPKEIVTKGKDQHSPFHKKFYSSCGVGSTFHEEYIRLVRNKIQPIFDCDIVFQRMPTFRVHLPNNLAVFEFHKDKDYNHLPEEMNFFLPFTTAFDSNSIWIESEEDKGDYNPIVAGYGDIVMFDGANLKHGNKLNTTKQTRISIDFRALPLKDFQSNHKVSITSCVPLEIGQYWQIMPCLQHAQD